MGHRFLIARLWFHVLVREHPLITAATKIETNEEFFFSLSLPYCWAFLVAQLVKNPPAMQETWVWSLGWEDPVEKGKATHSSILA